MNLSLTLLALLTSLTWGTAFAKEETLATITNDDNKEVFTFIAVTDDNSNVITSFFKDEYVDGVKITRENLAISALSNDGLALDKRDDLTVINLKSDNFDTGLGGVIVVDTLYNGINGQRKEYEINLAQSKDGWQLYDENRPITKIHLEVNKKLLIGTVGVKNIKME
jgi:hypothetical protein